MMNSCRRHRYINHTRGTAAKVSKGKGDAHTYVHCRLTSIDRGAGIQSVHVPETHTVCARADILARCQFESGVETTDRQTRPICLAIRIMPFLRVS